MNRSVLFTILIVITIGVGYYFYTKTPPSSPQPPAPLSPTPSTPTLPPFVLPTPAPVTTKYLLTEQAILLNFPAVPGLPYKTFASQTVFDTLFKNQQNSNILSLMKTDGKSTNPPSLDCYALYTNTFTNTYSETDDKFSNEYDILGAYFITTLLSLQDVSLKYYDNTKKISFSTDTLSHVMKTWGLTNSTNQSSFSAGGENPTLLDDFVPRISRYLFANYANRMIVDYKTKKANCK
jgi:hypothetical protein